MYCCRKFGIVTQLQPVDPYYRFYQYEVSDIGCLQDDSSVSFHMSTTSMFQHVLGFSFKCLPYFNSFMLPPCAIQQQSGPENEHFNTHCLCRAVMPYCCNVSVNMEQFQRDCALVKRIVKRMNEMYCNTVCCVKLKSPAF